MRIGDRHLTYCTNIHPARGVEAIEEALATHAVALRDQLAGGERFGLGLRLSASDSRQLARPGALDAFRRFLDAHGLYAFTVNGFPYGNFHGEPVKADVHAPDWRRPERAAYTVRLADQLAALLPDGVDGSISTSPLSYRDWLADDDARGWQAAVDHLVEVAAHLVRLADRQGKTIRLCLEPEPDGRLETTAEFVDFATGRLLDRGAAILADRLAMAGDEAADHLRNHVGLCLDACHAAVAYEEADAVFDRVDAAGLQIPKVQLSSALRVDLDEEPARRQAVADALRPFDEAVYLHQVVARRADGGLERFADLGPALEAIARPELVEYRVHFHVPIFCKAFGQLGSTQPDLAAVLDRVVGRSDCRHLEIETYTFDVLPGVLDCPLTEAIARDYRWAIDRL